MRFVVLALLASCVLFPLNAMAASIPNLLAWQGVALDATDAPLASGTYTFRFAIYDDPSGGALIWEETQAVNVVNGLVNVLLGSANPLPDTTFDAADRFLEVQFESEAPYFPRTRIVAVGYAFRTMSINGASGGSITNGTSSIANIQGSLEGGQLELLDEAGETVVSAGADSDGEGGSAYLFGDASASTGIALDGNSAGSTDPLLSVLGSTSAFSFNSSLPGDQALSLPVGAIVSPDIADEAGMAAGVRQGAVLDIGTTFVPLAMTTATFPADGYALVVVEATLRAKGVDSWVDGLLLDDGQAVESWFWDAGDPDPWFDANQIHMYAAPVTAGPHTYELQVKQNSGTMDATNARVMVFFYPTAYGVVASSVPSLGIPSADGAQPLPTLAEPLDADAERAAATAANADRISRELDAMRERMTAMEAELREAKAWIDRERQ